MVLSPWQSHCQSSPCSFDERRFSARWPLTHSPSHQSLSPLVKAAAIRIQHRRLLLLLSPKDEYTFHVHVSGRVEG